MAWIKSYHGYSRLVKLCVLYFGLVAVEAMTPLCSYGWIGKSGGSCYKVLDELQTYSVSMSECQLIDATSYLAVANDQGENEFLSSLTPDKIWLGCDATDGDGIWRCRDGSGKTYDATRRQPTPPNSYWNWDSGQPGAYSNGQCQVQYQQSPIWHSISCSSTYQGVCETNPDLSTKDFASLYDFVFTYLQPQDDEITGSFAYMLITTTSTDPGQISIGIPGLQRYERHRISYQTPANITLPNSVYLTGSGKQNKAIIVRSEVPISVQAMYIYLSYRTTGFSVLPTTLLGKEYFVSSYNPHESEKSEYSITALAGQTNITIDSSNIAGGSVQELTLEPYESYQFQSTNDLTGVNIRASNPVCVMSGATGVRIRADTGGPEYLIQNLLPVENLGTRYILTPFKGRTSGYIYRVVATEPHTVLTFPPTQVVNLDAAGSIYERPADTPLVILSNKPILVVQFAKSHHSDAKGDTFMLIIPPIVDTEAGEISFPVTDLATASIQRSYMDVTIPCENVGQLTLDDQYVATDWERLTIMMDGTLYCVFQLLVSKGVHKIGVHSSDKVPYHAMVYGFGDLYVGYAFALWRLPKPNRISSSHTSFSKASTITCDTQMVLYLNSSYIEPDHYQDVHLNDPSCTGEMYDNNTIRIATEFNACGTEMTITDNDLIFSNKIIYRTQRSTQAPIDQGNNTIQYFDLNIKLTCTVPRRGNSSLGEFIGPINANDAGFGHLKFSLDMYKDSDFRLTYTPDDYPVLIEEGQSIYLAASAMSISDVRLTVETCRVTPSRNPDDAIKYTIMENGCGTDHPIKFYDSTSTTQQQFSMPMYSFFDNQPKMFIHCDMIVCGFNDTTSCPPLLASHCPQRLPRDTNFKHAPSMSKERVTVSTTGSFKVQSTTNPRKYQDQTQTGIILAAVGGVSLCVALIIVTSLALKRIRGPSSYSAMEEVEMNEFTT